MNRVAPTPVSLHMPGPAILPQAPVPPEVLNAWRVALEAMAAHENPEERNQFVSQFMAQPNRVMRIEAAEHPDLLGAACRATLHLINPVERQTVAAQLITRRSVQIGTQSGDATVMHALAQAMHALNPEAHSEALSDLLTGQGAIEALTGQGRPDIVADIAYDASQRIPRGAGLQSLMADLLKDDAVDAAMESGRPDVIGKTALATCALSDTRRTAVMNQVATSGPAMACVRDTGSVADISQLADALAAQRTPACTTSLEGLMTPAATRRVVNEGTAFDRARWTGAAGQMAMAAVHLEPEAGRRLLEGLMTPELGTLLAKDASALFRTTVACGRLLEGERRGDAMVRLWSSDAIGTMRGAGDLSALSFVAGAMANWLPAEHRGAAVAALLPDDAFRLAHESRRPDIIDRMTSAAEVLPEGQRHTALALLRVGPPTYQQIMANERAGAAGGTPRSSSPSHQPG